MNKILLIPLWISWIAIANSQMPGFWLNETTSDRIKARGYGSEAHEVVTPDGYILTLFRITNKQGNTAAAKHPPVLLMHGLLSSSDCWVIGEEEHVLAFYLIDSGYDVWLGNARGNPYSLRHKVLSSEDERFWRFSFHQIGLVDLPTFIDYILKVTNQKALHYSGHSQGTTIMFILLSTKPEYSEKLITSHLLAPVAFMKHVRSPVFRFLTLFLGRNPSVDMALGAMPALQQPLIRQLLGFEHCRNPEANPHRCAGLLYELVGGTSKYLNTSLVPQIFNSHPASASFFQVIHYIQLVISGRFRRFDFGSTENLRRYNSSRPPDYQLENIKPRFALDFYYSDYDELSTTKDIDHLTSILGDNAVRHFIDLSYFTHIDFLYAPNAKELLYMPILKRMQDAEREIG